MNILKIFLMISMLTVAAQKAEAIVYSSGTLNQAIPDGDATGLSSTYTVLSGAEGIANISVTLNISGGFNGDLYAYLTHDNQTAILLNRIGTSGAGTFGNSGSGMNVTLTLDAASNIHGVTGALTGPYLADGRYASPMDLVGSSRVDLQACKLEYSIVSPK